MIKTGKKQIIMMAPLSFVLSLVLIQAFIASNISTASEIEDIVEYHWKRLEESGLLDSIVSEQKRHSFEAAARDNQQQRSNENQDHPSTCNHDAFMRNNRYAHKVTRKPGVKPTDFPLLEADVAQKRAFTPIRIFLNESMLSSSDPYSCYTVGQQVESEVLISASNYQLYTCNSSDILTPSKITLLQSYVMPAVVGVVQQMVSILRTPITGNLLLDQAYHQVRGYFCRNHIPIPLFLFTAGQPNADIYVFVSARPGNPSDGASVVATAVPCSHKILSFNPELWSRPLAASINFNPGASEITSFMLATDLDYEFAFMKLVKLGVHEMTHALGFTSNLYPNFINPSTGLVYGDEGPVTTVQVGDPTAQYTSYRMIGANVLAFAQTHFACPSLSGMELENNDPGVGPGSHWEKRVAGSEYMTAVTSSYMPISGLTLALLKDTGWYDISTSIAENWVWGFEQGCEFLGKCSDNWSPDYFCTTMNDNDPTYRKCNAERTAKSHCDLAEYSMPLPSYWQYFPDPTMGGGVWRDYCPSYEPYTNYWCRDQRLTGDAKLGENFGSKSSCFDIDYRDGTSRLNTACYEIKCVINGETDNAQIAFRVGGTNGPNATGGTWFGCPVGTAGWTPVPTPDGRVWVSCPSLRFACAGTNFVRWNITNHAQGLRFGSAWLVCSFFIHLVLIVMS